jgi:glycyl-tRNA synthetase (class II)
MEDYQIHGITAHLGVELKNNIKKAWWQKFITQSPYNVGIDAAILNES